jgi:hypothetical protein
MATSAQRRIDGRPTMRRMIATPNAPPTRTVTPSTVNARRAIAAARGRSACRRPDR